MERLLKIRKLNKAYGDEVVFTDFSADIKLGSTNVIMGKSGAGKTTLLRILMGLDTEYRGDISMEEADGNEVKWNPDKNKLSAVFQDNALWENLSGVMNVAMVTKSNGNTKSTGDIEESFLKLGITREDAHKKVSEMSGGMKRRVAIIRALLADYDMLFLDEPFKEMDEETKDLAIAYFREITKDKTVIYVTHNKWEVRATDNMIYLDSAKDNQ